MRQEDDLARWLEQVAVGTPASVFADDVNDISVALEAILTSVGEPTRVVTLRWERVPPLGNELTLLVEALAQATTRLYPDLYGTNHALEGRWTEAELETAVYEVRRRIPDVLGVACRQILRACRDSQLPRVRRMSKSEEVRQLSLAIEPNRLVILVAVTDASVHSVALRALAQGAEWLATHSRARVVLVLPRALRRAPELDHVTYVAYVGAPIQPPPIEADIATSNAIRTSPWNRTEQVPSGEGVSVPPARVSVSPSSGKPHPKSEVEKALYERIRADQHLAPLFGFNLQVQTRYRTKPRVDLLCEKHKLVIEIDGEEHRGLLTWTNDRKRDVELLLSGYRVMRFPNSTLVENTEQVLTWIRHAVELFDRPMVEGQESK